ncbi:MAG: DUF892 family protein [Candidatus Cyclobacteriaceae bacterium M3_2C_046]
MTYNDFFKQEETFEESIQQLYNVEIQMSLAFIKLERQASDQQLKNLFIQLQKNSQLKLMQLEELSEIYDIPLSEKNSPEVELLISEAEKFRMNYDDLAISDNELKTTARKIEDYEKNSISCALRIADKLGYNEAKEILNPQAI